MTKNIAVIGMGFGDEGKGMVTSYLSSVSKKPLVVRFSGGHQAGHTVNHNGIKHTFANFGSGTLDGVPTYWSKSCTVDPVGLINELQIIVDKMKDGFDNIQLFINQDCPVTTPFDKAYNRKQDRDQMHGSCGVGFGATIEREENHFSLKFSDLFDPTILEIKLNLIRKYYNMFLDKHSHIMELADFTESIKLLKDPDKFPHDAIQMVDDIPEDFETHIFEGSQGLLLDKDIGFFPHVTRSNVGAGNLSLMTKIHEVYYVTRSYQTRHGEGPMTNQDKKLHILKDVDEANKTNLYQGAFRTSVLDLDLLKYALQQDRKGIFGEARQKLVVTCMDQLTSYQYVYHGNLNTCMNFGAFVGAIRDNLAFDDNIYLSWSEKSELNEWKEVT